MDMISRYFLRRFAIARGKKKWASPSGPYHDALVEAILVFTALPAAGLLSFLGLSTLKWWDPVVRVRWPWLGFRTAGLIVWILSVLVGHLLLSKRLRQYRDNPSESLWFSSDTDRRIVFWQKLKVTVACGLVAPWLGIAVNQLTK
jgi:hypothetical protein